MEIVDRFVNVHFVYKYITKCMYYSAPICWYVIGLRGTQTFEHDVIDGKNTELSAANHVIHIEYSCPIHLSIIENDTISLFQY